MTNKNESISGVLQDNETMLALVTHDLKNPVTAGMMAIKLLEDKNLSPLNPYQKEIVTSIAGSYKYMKNLIENLLDRYKVINHEYRLNKQPVNFLCLINSAIEEYRFLFQEKGQIIKFSSSIKNYYVNIDSLEMKRVIHNLITNACNYAPKDSEIRISLCGDNTSIICSIENSGCNFQLSDNIFDKFYTENNNSKTVATGLGLYIAKQIINAHNGSIHIDSEINKYTRVIFSIPLK